MARCRSCGGLLGPDAGWCGQCFTMVQPREAERPREAEPPPADHPPVPPPSLASEPIQPLGADAALAAIPPDIQITLAGATRVPTALGISGKRWVTALIVMLAVGSDALFFPYIRYMAAYGVFVGAPSAYAIWRLWNRRSVKRGS